MGDRRRSWQGHQASEADVLWASAEWRLWQKLEEDHLHGDPPVHAYTGGRGASEAHQKE